MVALSYWTLVAVSSVNEGAAGPVCEEDTRVSLQMYDTPDLSYVQEHTNHIDGIHISIHK